MSRDTSAKPDAPKGVAPTSDPKTRNLNRWVNEGGATVDDPPSTRKEDGPDPAPPKP